MKRLLLAGLIGLLGSTSALAGDERREAIVAGALGGAAGAVIGQQMGGALGAGLAVDDHDHDRPAYYGGHAAPVAYYPARPVAYYPARPVAYYPARPVAYYPARPVAYAPARPVVINRTVVVPRGHYHPVARHVAREAAWHDRRHHDRHHDH